jgi:hypothetical protein
MPPNQHEEAQSDFLAGKQGMILGSSALLNGPKSGASFKLGVAVFPVVGIHRNIPLGGAAWQFSKTRTSASPIFGGWSERAVTTA